MQEENRVEKEFLKLERDGIKKYKLPKDFDEWTNEEKTLLSLALAILGTKIDYKKEFLKVHRRRVAIISVVLFVGLSFINPFLGLGAASVIIIVGYLFDHFIEKMEV